MKEDDLIEDVQSLIKQYGFEPEIINQIEVVDELIENYEAKIHLYKALIGGFETSLDVWRYIKKQIINQNK